MTTLELLSRALKLDIKLWLENGRLRYNAPQGAMTPDLQAELAKHKAEIITYLQTYPRPATSDQACIDQPKQAHKIAATGIDQQRPVQILLTPSQCWFLKVFTVRPAQFSINRCFEVNLLLDVDLLLESFRHLFSHHDMLRAYFILNGQEWQQFIAHPDQVTPFLFVHDFSQAAPGHQQELIEQTAQDLQDSHDLSHPPLLRVAYLNLGPGTPSRLMFSLHHLIADGYSLGVILEDFLHIYTQLSAGQPVSLPPKTTSFEVYGEKLLQHARQVAQRELDYWLRLPWDQGKPLPMDMPHGRNQDTYASLETVPLDLGYLDTQALFRLVKDRATTGIQLRDILLTALALTFKQWKGLDALFVRFEHFGRNMLMEDGVDLSLTVGWIALISHLLLVIGEIDEPRQALNAIRRQMNALPGDGLGVSLLEWLAFDKESASLAKPILSLPRPHIFFNLLDGRSTLQEKRPSLFNSPVEILSDWKDRRDDALEIFVRQTEKGLLFSFRYGPTVYRRSTMETLVELYRKNLLTLIHILQRESS